MLLFISYIYSLIHLVDMKDEGDGRTAIAYVFKDEYYYCKKFYLVRSKNDFSNGDRNETIEIFDFTRVYKQNMYRKNFSCFVKNIQEDYFYSFKLVCRNEILYTSAFIKYKGEWLIDKDFDSLFRKEKKEGKKNVMVDYEVVFFGGIIIAVAIIVLILIFKLCVIL